MTPERLRAIATRIETQCVELRHVMILADGTAMPEYPCDGCIADARDLREHADTMETANATIANMLTAEELAALPELAESRRKKAAKLSADWQNATKQ